MKPSAGRRASRFRRRAVLSTGAGIIAAGVGVGCDTLSMQPEGEPGARSADTDQKEAPSLAERVKRGDLPPLARRLPANPVVEEPLNAIGRYGGTLRGNSLGPGNSDIHCALVPGLFRFSDDLSEAVPEVAESFNLADDYLSCEIKLREGLRWSDGEAFTVDDVIFYFEDWQFDPDLSPVVSSDWARGGERMIVSRVDDYTVRFEFAAANPAFALLHYSSPPMTPYRPAHFFRDMHPKYNRDAERAAKDAGYSSWVDRFLYFAEPSSGTQDPKRPDLTPWVPVELGQQRERYERNPFYWKVDPEGRQLPYIDELIIEYVPDLQATQLKAQSGEVDIASRNLEIANYPLLKSDEERGNYRAVLMLSEYGSDIALGFNQEHKDAVLREIFRDIRFRRAVSVAINRNEINKLVFLEQGTPRQATINESATFFDEEWARSYAQYDPDLANSLLDDMGLTQRDTDGIRLRPDGDTLSFQLQFPPEEGPKLAAAELVVEHLKGIGLDVAATPRDKGYMATLVESGGQDATIWQVNRALERSSWAQATTTNKLRPGGSDVLTYAQAWVAWFDSDGQEGTEPPEEAKELQQALEEWQNHGFGEAGYDAAARHVYSLVEQSLWTIGTVGQGPVPVLVSKNLENVFVEAVFRGEEWVWWGAANWYWRPHRPEQWFFTE